MVENREWLSLDDGETVVWTGQPRLWRIFPSVVKSAFWALVFVAAAIVGPRYAPPAIPGIAVTSVGLLLALASLEPGVAAYLRTSNVYYVLTTRNVCKRVGIWSTNVIYVAVTDVQSIRLTKDVWGTLFDYGSVAVSTAGSSGTDVVFTDLERPETVRDALQQAMSEARERSRTVEAPPAEQRDAPATDRVVDDARALREAAERLETEMTTR